MLRVNSNAVLVVPPFECAWLQGPEKIESGCCVSFEVKGENDVTIILKSEAGGRRWQHFAHNGGIGALGQHADGARHADDLQQRTERNYTVILGSHRNSCIKIEKDGQLCDRASNVPGTKLSASRFLQFWVSYSAGSISIGTGAPGSRPPCYSWLDPGPAAAIEHVGLSSWDHHVAYRNIQITAPVQLPPQGDGAAAAARQQPADSVSPVVSLQEQCSAALQRAFHPASVCSVLGMADVMRPSADALRDAAVAFLAEHLPAVLAADTPGLQALSFDCMLDLLQHTALGCEELGVFAAVATWARCEAAAGQPDSGGSADGDSPHSDGHGSGGMEGIVGGSGSGGGGGGRDASPDPALEQLLPLVRFPLMTSEQLAALAGHPLRRSSPVLSDLLAEARLCHRAEAARQQPSRAADCAQAPAALEVADMRHVRLRTSSADAAAARRQQRRPGAGATELMFVSHGDTNGVCHWLGCNRGSSPWVNPHAAGRLTVRASSPACRNTDPKALVGLNFAGVNFAGPRLEGGGRATWWILDLGPSCVLACNYYTLRADASPNFPRGWSLQAAQDGVAWVDLLRHTNDTSLSLSGQFASWPVGGPAAQRPYRYFRVLLAQGPGAAVTHPTELSLSHFELYGWATDTVASKGAEGSS